MVVIKSGKKIRRIIWVLFSLAMILSCQKIQTSQTRNLENSLSSDNGLLDLSLSTLEQQNIEKLKAAEFLSEARKKRIIIAPEQIEQPDRNSNVNLALYARQTPNLVGKKLYLRLSRKSKKSNSCLRFLSQEDSQRFFLEKGGPEKDLWNLDPDGDGFACEWDPEPYRKFYGEFKN